MKPRRTEYNGICFRSKSEAIFARYLDIILDEFSFIRSSVIDKQYNISKGYRGGFQYEPRTLIDGWKPDFLVWDISVPHTEKPYFFWNVPTLSITYIEYKPSRPTSTYVSEWMAYVDKWLKMARAESADYTCRTKFRIYYGSVFSSAKRGVITKYPVSEVEHDECDWLANRSEELLEYRFDLEQQGVN